MNFIKDFEVTKETGSQLKIVGEIPFAELEKEKNAAIKKLGQNVEMDGFRKGHVPENILMEKIGEMAILSEMAERALSKVYPEILKANKIQKKVSEIGFEYKSDLESIDKIIEEAKELKTEIKDKNKKKIEEELGDLIFACLDVARKLNFNPEIILSKANNKFINRWNKVEIMIKKDKKKFNELDMKKFNRYWNLAKI